MAVSAKSLDPKKGPVWAEINLRAITGNFCAIRKHIGAHPKILAVVKADAYGHGAPQVARALGRAGVDCFGVTCTREGAELRAAGIRQPILVLTGFWPGEESRQLEYGLTPSITCVEQVKWLERAAAKRARSAKKASRTGHVAFHLKIDTGMNRLGLPCTDVRRFCEALSDCRHLKLAGVFTHFAAAEDFSSGQTEEQIRSFACALGQLEKAGVQAGTVHMANSAAIAARRETWRDMVRPGALLYGYHQFYEPPQRRGEFQKLLPLQPALALRARIVSLKDVAAGTAVGYNARFVTARPSRIAVLAAGYAEGVVRLLTNRGKVMIHGRCAPLVGTISMDLAMLDVTEVPEARIGDVVTIVGAQPTANGDSLYADDVAHELGTVTSDLLCAIGRRVPRVFV